MSLIARGGMGEVYRATDSVLQRKVAVKLLSERHAGDEDVRARFRREALAAARLSGTPHIITVFDVGEHRRRPFIVMEYLDGGSIHDRLRDGRIAPGQALEWLAQAGIALDRAHAEGVVHRDVKPANLLLDRDANLVVTDFGIASTTGVDTLTLPGTVLGTAGYLSPEQARGEPATAASDRYGLGVVAFELLTGRRPFEGDTAATEALAHVTAPVPSAESIHPELPDGVDEVLARALAKDPVERPETCSELVRDLRDAFSGAARRPAPTLVAPVAGRGRGAGGSRPPAASRRSPTTASRVRRTAGCSSSRPGSWSRASARRRSSARSATEGGKGNAANRTTSQRSTTQATQTTQTTQTETTDTIAGMSGRGARFGRIQAHGGRRLRGRVAAPRTAPSAALGGTGSLDEAYSLYNLAYTRFALGRCDGVLEMLDRSENIQGERSAIDALYAQARDRCVGGGGGGGGDDD